MEEGLEGQVLPVVVVATTDRQLRTEERLGLAEVGLEGQVLPGVVAALAAQRLRKEPHRLVEARLQGQVLPEVVVVAVEAPVHRQRLPCR